MNDLVSLKKFLANCPGRFLKHDNWHKKIMHCGPVLKTELVNNILVVSYEWVASPAQYHTPLTWIKHGEITQEIELEDIKIFPEFDESKVIYVIESEAVGTTTKIYPQGFKEIGAGQIVFG